MAGNLKMKKPYWLDKKINLEKNREIKTLLRGLRLSTVCENALCPNISECFGCGTATIMIMGDSCTRSCSFCAVDKSKPLSLDDGEPQRVKAAVLKLKLNYVVLTSPTRDDLPDGGAAHFARAVSVIKSISEKMKVEILVPDFLGNKNSFGVIAACGADVIAHNVETVPSLYTKVRQGADYGRSLGLLSYVKKISVGTLTKSGIMLGLGEAECEVFDVMRDLREACVDILTIGQYLAPSSKHYPVCEYVSPETFSTLKDKALKLGFKYVQSSPYTRSSYLAADLI
jgi:lipoic acid synthetase